MTYAGSSIAVRVSTAITIGFAMVSLTATTGSAETRRVVVRVYETGIGDVALRTAAIRTAASIVEMAGVFVEWYDCTDNGRRPVCQDARRSGNFIARIMPTLTPGAPLRKLSVEALGAQGDASRRSVLPSSTRIRTPGRWRRCFTIKFKPSRAEPASRAASSSAGLSPTRSATCCSACAGTAAAASCEPCGPMTN